MRSWSGRTDGRSVFREQSNMAADGCTRWVNHAMLDGEVPTTRVGRWRRDYSWQSQRSLGAIFVSHNLPFLSNIRRFLQRFIINSAIVLRLSLTQVVSCVTLSEKERAIKIPRLKHAENTRTRMSVSFVTEDVSCRRKKFQVAHVISI